MQCLYCGREIGAFKLRRDGEFCSKDHRKNYGDRLNRALLRIAQPEPPPAGVAGFSASWPARNGSVLPSLHGWDPGKGHSGFRPGLVLAAANAALEADSVENHSVENHSENQEARIVEKDPPLCGRWMPAWQAEPAASFVQASTAQSALFPRSTRLPAFSMAAELAVRVPRAGKQCMPGRQAEPVESFVTTALSANIPCLAKPPAFSMAVNTVTAATAAATAAPLAARKALPSAGWMPAPQAEAAETMVFPSLAAVFASAPAPVRLLALDLVAEHAALVAPEEPMAIPGLCEGWMPSLRAEPVAQMVWPAVGEPFFTDISILLRSSVVPYTLPALPKAQITGAGTAAMPVPNAEPVATLVSQTMARNVIPSRHQAAPQMPAFATSPVLIAVLAPPVDDETFVEPPLCQDWMRAAEPEPVSCLVRSSAAGEVFTGIAPQLASLALAIARPHIPASVIERPVAPAQPTTTGVWQPVGATPLSLLSAPGELRLPGIVALSPLAEPSGAKLRPEVAAPVGCPAPVPLESWLRVAAEISTTMAVPAGCRLPELETPALVGSGPMPVMAGPVAGAPPVGAECLLVSTAATARAPYAPVVQMPPFLLTASTRQTARGVEQPSLTATPAAPKPPNHIAVLGPIWTISVTTLEPENSAPLPTIPQPGFIPVDYHTQRMRGEPVCRLPWQTSHLQPAPPRFVVRPVFDRLEEGAPAPKPARKGPAFAEVFTMPEVKKHSNRSRVFAYKAIAAGLVIGAMWLGTGVVRLGHSVAVSTSGSRQNVFSGPDGASPGPSLSAAARKPVHAPGQSATTGPVGWIHNALANRASYQAGDNFREGMQAWGSAPKAYAAGWQRNRDGYVRPGELALFGPTLKLADYRFEFFGQVDQKSMGWVVRAKDPQNYYAMKVKVLTAGLRPIIAVVHYPVVGGKPGHSVETPLNVMVHNNRPFQVAINVKGSHFSASIDGEEVDSWSDDALPSGGVGFFAEAGASARLYWMKVTRNDDWLGRVCGKLSGSGSGAQVTTELWGPAFADPQPGGNPRPAAPSDAGNVTLAAAGLGLPAFKARRAKDSKYLRYQPWNS
jgi:hypothetical protein